MEDSDFDGTQSTTISKKNQQHTTNSSPQKKPARFFADGVRGVNRWFEWF
jgi:hypothetical protein